MPSPRSAVPLLRILPLAACLLTGLSACQKKAGETPPPTVAGVPALPAPAPVPSAVPPPEQYAKLPPGAYRDSPPPDDAGAPEAPPAAKTQADADPGLVPNAGTFDLTGIRLGMSTIEVYERYPADSGWGYDKHFTPGSETGVILAKPNDPRARASEMLMLQDGVVVAFLRAVEEDSAAFTDSVAPLERFGAATAAPPDWARKFNIFRSWHETPNEESRFWSKAGKQQVLTAGHAPDGTETVYMLLDLPRMDQVEEAMKSAGQTPPPDFGWSSPGQGSGTPPAAPGN